MKRVLYCSLAVVLLSCGSSPLKEEKIVVYRDTVVEIEEATIDSISEPRPTGLSGLHLNNGVKWKADAKTVANVSLLKAVVADARKKQPVNYGLTAAELQKGLDKMVAECSMKGPDHDALHQWLLPLVKKVNELKKASGGQSVVMLREIAVWINLFDEYFA